jgi:prolyl oligopeptidase
MAVQFEPISITYPKTQKDTSIVDDYFGTRVADPYRWLEDDQSPATKEWVDRQNLVTNGYLSQIPFRESIKNRLFRIFNFERYSSPFTKAGKYYYFKNDGLQNQSVLYAQDSLRGPSRLVLDPNAFSNDGTASLQEYSFNKRGDLLAFSVSKGGSDWRTIRVLDLTNGKMLEDEIEWAKFTDIAWYKDGFFYTRYPTPKKGDELKGTNQLGALWYHKLGTFQSKDQKIFEDADHPNRFFSGSTTEDERYLCIFGSESTSGNTLYVKDLNHDNSPFVTIADNFRYDYSVIGSLGERILLKTNHNAPNQRLLAIHPSQPEEKDWEEIIPENFSDVLKDVDLCGGKILCSYLHNAASSMRVFDTHGGFLQEIKLPEIGSVSGISGEKELNLAFYTFDSFLRPGTVFSIDLQSMESTVFKAPKLDFDPTPFITEQVWVISKDGTRVPVFITHKKGLMLDGNNPVLLYGYGGFNISISPVFSPSRAVFLEQGGVYAVANIRGGGEFGEVWHKAGTLCNKQHVFDDFISAATYLIDKKYTQPARLAIQGGSNGGLLVGACMTQRPDLFGVCIPQVGVLDMLRYHKFTIGYAWAVDYGRSDEAASFPCLYAYSPLHNIREKSYPATLITTADHDDRVVPAHSFKFAATLQEQQTGNSPILIRIDKSAGHGAGKPTSKIIEEASDLLSFLFWQMKFEPKNLN